MSVTKVLHAPMWFEGSPIFQKQHHLMQRTQKTKLSITAKKEDVIRSTIIC